MPDDDDEGIFPPGKYSWWSVQGPTIQNKPYKQERTNRDLHGYGYSLSEQLPLEGSPFSRYGTVAFRVDFQTLLQAYINAYNQNGDVEVIFKTGGTLRYQREICKVIIVCAKIDGRDPLSDFPPMAIDLSQPELHITCGITGGYHYLNFNTLVDRDCFNCSWDNYTFAFHFPTEHDQELVLDNEHVTPFLVEHNCHSADGARRQEPSNHRCLRGDWCPDSDRGKISLKDLQ